MQRRQLTEARRANPHVVPLLISSTDVPPVPPTSYSIGGVDEDVSCILQFRAACDEPDGAMEWLQSLNRSPCRRTTAQTAAARLRAAQGAKEKAAVMATNHRFRELFGQHSWNITGAVNHANDLNHVSVDSIEHQIPIKAHNDALPKIRQARM